MNVELIQGRDALSLLAGESFRAQWSQLWRQCPWATAFQSFEFANVWYSTYGDSMEPVFALSRSADGNLQGLLTLARNSDGKLMVAGGFQAEYHAWLSTPDFGNEFPARAIELLQSLSDSSPLAFKYLAPGSPTQWLSQRPVKARHHLRTCARPLLKFGDGSEIVASLKNRKTRRKLRDLNEVAEVSFTQITHPEEFAPFFDQMVRLRDFRHGAIHGSPPFCTFPLQREFHLAMMNTPGLMHVTALRVGDRMIAAHFGARGHREIHMGTLAHDPAFSRFSPGRLLILMLAQMLWEQGNQQLDMTPGDDAYKINFATEFDQAFELTVFPSRRRAIQFQFAEKGREFSRRACRIAGTTPVEARLRLRNLPRPIHVPMLLVRKAVSWMASDREDRVYRLQTAGLNGNGPIRNEAEADSIRRDSWDDLLAYHAPARGPSRQQFLSNALRRIEDGEHVYTCAKSGRLLQLAWVIEQSETSQIGRLLPDFPLPAQCTVVYEFSSFSRPENWQLAAPILRTVVRDSEAIASKTGLYIIVPGRNLAAQRLIEKLGFTHVGSQHRRMTLGHERRWIDSIELPRAATTPGPRPTAERFDNSRDLPASIVETPQEVRATSPSSVD